MMEALVATAVALPLPPDSTIPSTPANLLNGPPVLPPLRPLSPAHHHARASSRSTTLAQQQPPSPSSPPPHPPPIASSSFLPLPPAPFASSLAARRQKQSKNKKHLSLVVPSTSASSSASSSKHHPPSTPNPPSLLAGSTAGNADAAASATRSLPPSPVSLTTLIGLEGSEQEDRTIGRLMMKQQVDELREQMKGGRGMKRRTSLPRLSLAKQKTALRSGSGRLGAIDGSSLSLGTTNGGSAVKMLRRNGSEGMESAIDLDDGEEEDEEEDDDDELGPEEYPYERGPREILPGIWLGSEQNARDPAVLKEFGFILNVAKEVLCPWMHERTSATTATLPVGDHKEDQHQVTVTVDEPPEDRLRIDLERPRSGSKESDFEVDFATLPITPLFPPSSNSSRKSSNNSTTFLSSAMTLRSKPSQHRRTKTHAVILAPSPMLHQPRLRPTTSTPNLQSAFNTPAHSPPPAPNAAAASTFGANKVLSSLFADERNTRNSTSHESTATAASSSASSSFATAATSPTVLPSPAQKKRTSSASSPAAAAAASASASTPVLLSLPANEHHRAIEYMWTKWGHDEADLVEQGKFQQAFDFIDRARATAAAGGEAGKVLVHCQVGISRSATLVIAYCMREAARAIEQGKVVQGLQGVTGMTSAFTFVKGKSEWVGPNLHLIFQLVAYERILRGAVNDDDSAEEEAYPHTAALAANAAAAAALDSPELPSSSYLSIDPSQSSFPPPIATSSVGPNGADMMNDAGQGEEDRMDSSSTHDARLALSSLSIDPVASLSNNAAVSAAAPPTRTPTPVFTFPPQKKTVFDPSSSLSNTPPLLSTSIGGSRRGSGGISFGSQSASERRASHVEVFATGIHLGFDKPLPPTPTMQ